MNWTKISERPIQDSDGRLLCFTDNEDHVTRYRALDAQFAKECENITHYIVIEDPKPELPDEVINGEVYQEVIWRLNNEFKTPEMFEMFGEECDLAAEKDYLAEMWIQGDKDLVPHPRHNRLRNWAYQSCLKGFKQWVSSYAKKRCQTPVSERKLKTSHRQAEEEYSLLKQTALAIGKPANYEWHIHWKPERFREIPFELDEEKLRAFARAPGEIGDKRMYLAYHLDGKPCSDPHLLKILGETLKEIEGAHYRMDAEILAEAKEHFAKWEHLGRPRSVERWRPEYTRFMGWPGHWKLNKDFFTEFDKQNPPVYKYDRNGDKIK